MSEEGEEEEGDGVEGEDDAGGDADLLVVGIDDRGNCGDGAAAADGGADVDEHAGFAVDADELHQQEADGDGDDEAEGAFPDA